MRPTHSTLPVSGRHGRRIFERESTYQGHSMVQSTCTPSRAYLDGQSIGILKESRRMELLEHEMQRRAGYPCCCTLRSLLLLQACAWYVRASKAMPISFLFWMSTFEMEERSRFSFPQACSSDISPSVVLCLLLRGTCGAFGLPSRAELRYDAVEKSAAFVIQSFVVPILLLHSLSMLLRIILIRHLVLC